MSPRRIIEVPEVHFNVILPRLRAEHHPAIGVLRELEREAKDEIRVVALREQEGHLPPVVGTSAYESLVLDIPCASIPAIDSPASQVLAVEDGNKALFGRWRRGMVGSY